MKYLEDVEIKPCPFCGNDLVIPKISASDGICFLECQQCFSKGSTQDNMHMAVIAWNTRFNEGIRNERNC